ncbi:hypothetical protein MRX96_012530 [Rhipicephalus microplus]
MESRLALDMQTILRLLSPESAERRSCEAAVGQQPGSAARRPAAQGGHHSGGCRPSFGAHAVVGVEQASVRWEYTRAAFQESTKQHKPRLTRTPAEDGDSREASQASSSSTSSVAKDRVTSRTSDV